MTDSSRQAGRQAARVAFRSTSVTSTSADLLWLIKAASRDTNSWCERSKKKTPQKTRSGNMTWLRNLFHPALHPILQTNTACLWSSFHCHWCIFHEGIHCLPLILWHFAAAVWQSISSHYHLYSPNYRQQQGSYNSNVLLCHSSDRLKSRILTGMIKSAITPNLLREQTSHRLVYRMSENKEKWTSESNASTSNWLFCLTFSPESRPHTREPACPAILLHDWHKLLLHHFKTHSSF